VRHQVDQRKKKIGESPYLSPSRAPKMLVEYDAVALEKARKPPYHRFRTGRLPSLMPAQPAQMERIEQRRAQRTMFSGLSLFC
jgi:hypothetical protein